MSRPTRLLQRPQAEVVQLEAPVEQLLRWFERTVAQEKPEQGPYCWHGVPKRHSAQTNVFAGAMAPHKHVLLSLLSLLVWRKSMSLICAVIEITLGLRHRWFESMNVLLQALRSEGSSVLPNWLQLEKWHGQ